MFGMGWDDLWSGLAVALFIAAVYIWADYLANGGAEIVSIR